ncbi:MAG TPA: MBL fold metallo-hydrolase RNA specificity domain-containing protein [Flavobacteriaceae bacterium]|nr:MBL fold metallo-hydrolase RNA specificity domain-containing protein [Flavobacteriaceae bacterium]
MIETSKKNILIDCGMFQVLKELRERNWEEFPFPPSEIDLVLLTHGHLDHCGYIPRLVRQGFREKIVGTAPTLAITKIILLDSAKIHEEEAEKANREGYSKHLQSLSAHADQQELLEWTSELEYKPREVFLIHGEPTAQDGLRVKPKDLYDWKVTMPKLDSVKEIFI